MLGTKFLQLVHWELKWDVVNTLGTKKVNKPYLNPHINPTAYVFLVLNWWFGLSSTFRSRTETRELEGPTDEMDLRTPSFATQAHIAVSRVSTSQGTTACNCSPHPQPSPSTAPTPPPLSLTHSYTYAISVVPVRCMGEKSSWYCPTVVNRMGTTLVDKKSLLFPASFIERA